MRHSVLLGSAAVILLIGAVSAVVLHRGGLTEGERTPPQMASLNQENPISEEGVPAAAKPAAQSPQVLPPSFDIVKVGPSGTTVIAGRAEPGSRVTVRDGDKVFGEVTADARGEWVLVPDQPIGPGDRLLSLEASSRQGGEPIKSGETVALSIPPSGPGRQGEAALAVLLPREGSGAVRVLQKPDARSPAALGAAREKLSMDTAEYDPEGRVVLSGHAEPGARVQIYIGNERVATATADGTGVWSATSSRAAAQGRLELRIDQLGEGGRVVRRLALPLAQVAAAQLAPGESYVVQSGNTLWQIARRTYGNGVRYLIIYSANQGQISEPDRIYPGQVFKLPKS